MPQVMYKTAQVQMLQCVTLPLCLFAFRVCPYSLIETLPLGQKSSFLRCVNVFPLLSFQAQLHLLLLDPRNFKRLP